MRLHSVHPFDYCSRQSRADNEIEVCALFLCLENSGAYKLSHPYGFDIVQISKEFRNFAYIRASI